MGEFQNLHSLSESEYKRLNQNEKLEKKVIHLTSGSYGWNNHPPFILQTHDQCSKINPF